MTAGYDKGLPVKLSEAQASQGDTVLPYLFCYSDTLRPNHG
jgi:hypothetical protein